MMTEVVDGDVAEGMEVITGVQSANGKPAQSSGPRMF
jgi:hypothetical protein